MPVVELNQFFTGILVLKKYSSQSSTEIEISFLKSYDLRSVFVIFFNCNANISIVNEQ